MSATPAASTPQHTPGPWTVTRKSEEPGVCLRRLEIQTPEGVVASVRHMGLKDTTWAANARLIAAAPELLEALRECITENGALSFASQDFYKAKQRLMAISNLARAAIANAKGHDLDASV